MKRFPIVFLSLSVATIATLGAVQQKWVGLITNGTLPTKYAQLARSAMVADGGVNLDLADLNVICVLPTQLSDEVADSVLASEVDEWATKRLKNLGLIVLSEKEQSNKFFLNTPKQDDSSILSHRDRYGAYANVSINAMRDLSMERTYYSISITVSRTMYAHPGRFTGGVVWSNGSFGYCHRDAIKDVIRRSVNAAIDKLATEWRKVNQK